jgi:hypothetical protein
MSGNWQTSVNITQNECAKFDQVIWGGGGPILSSTKLAVLYHMWLQFSTNYMVILRPLVNIKTKITIENLFLGQN